MMRLRHADLRIRSRAALARELERDDARQIGLERQHLQVEHQLHVVFPRFGHARRPVEIRERRLAVLLLRFLDPALDFAHGIEVLAHLQAIAGAELRLQPGHVLHHPVEDAGVLLELGAPLGGAPAVAEQPLEDHTRIGLGRQR